MEIRNDSRQIAHRLVSGKQICLLHIFKVFSGKLLNKIRSKSQKHPIGISSVHGRTNEYMRQKLAVIRIATPNMVLMMP